MQGNTLYCHVFLDKDKGIHKTLKLQLENLSLNMDALRTKIQTLVSDLTKVNFFSHKFDSKIKKF